MMRIAALAGTAPRERLAGHRLADARGSRAGCIRSPRPSPRRAAHSHPSRRDRIPARRAARRCRRRGFGPPRPRAARVSAPRRTACRSIHSSTAGTSLRRLKPCMRTSVAWRPDRCIEVGGRMVTAFDTTAGSLSRLARTKPSITSPRHPLWRSCDGDSCLPTREIGRRIDIPERRQLVPAHALRGQLRSGRRHGVRRAPRDAGERVDRARESDEHVAAILGGAEHRGDDRRGPQRPARDSARRAPGNRCR